MRAARASDGTLRAGPIAEAVVELGAYTVLLSSLVVALFAAPLIAAVVPRTVFALLVVFGFFYLITIGYVWAARAWVRSRSDEAVERSATGNWLVAGVFGVGYLSFSVSPWVLSILVVALVAVGTAAVVAPGLLDAIRLRLADLADEDLADEPVYGITEEARRFAGRLEAAPGPRPAVTVGPLVFFGAVGIYAVATWLPPELLAGGVAGVAAVGFLGLHLGRAVREEFTGDAAVLRDLEQRTGLRSREGTDDAEPELAELEATLTRLAGQADVPVPAIRLAESRTPTALSVGYRPASSTIVLSKGLIETLSERELEAVLAHELAHIANRDAAVLTALAAPGAIARLATDQYGFNPVVEPLAMLASGASRASVSFVARAREYAADDAAIAITGDTSGLAGALETLDSDLERRPETDFRELGETAAFSVVPPAWEEHRFFDRTRRLVSRGLFGTHPPTEKRIERLRARV